MQERLLRPQDIVEELLVMAMPFAAKHTSRSACKALTSPSAAPGEEDMTTPFAALRRQMAQDNEGSAE
jgi:uncharacterized metal-binding protein YceD (DUF177 family)